MSDKEVRVEPVATANYILKLEARIRRLRALIREQEKSLDSQWEEGGPADDHQLERIWYPTIERGDMTEE